MKHAAVIQTRKRSRRNKRAAEVVTFPASKIRRSKRPRKRLDAGQHPRKTAISLPADLRTFFEDCAHEQHWTLSRTLAVYLRETLDGKR